jgi:hypothetical protein
MRFQILTAAGMQVTVRLARWCATLSHIPPYTGPFRALYIYVFIYLFMYIIMGSCSIVTPVPFVTWNALTSSSITARSWEPIDPKLQTCVDAVGHSICLNYFPPLWPYNYYSIDHLHIIKIWKIYERSKKTNFNFFEKSIRNVRIYHVSMHS